MTRWASTIFLAISVAPTCAVYAQQYPSRPIRVVTSEVGGGNDFITRLVAPSLSNSLGQQIVVDNKPSGVIPPETVAKAAPDGYTLLLYSSAMWTLPFMRDSVPYDPVKDFTPITLVSSAPNILVVHPSLPVKTVKELIALAKLRRGELNYGPSVPSASSNLAAVLFKSMAGVDIMGINYKGTGPAINALIGGEVQIMFATAPSVKGHVASGRLRSLAVTSAKPSVLAPNLPTVASGLPGYESATAYGVFAPAKTPEAAIRRINQEFVRALNQADIKEKLFNTGVEVIASSPEQFADEMKSEMTKMGKLIKSAGIRAE